MWYGKKISNEGGRAHLVRQHSGDCAVRRVKGQLSQRPAERERPDGRRERNRAHHRNRTYMAGCINDCYARVNNACTQTTDEGGGVQPDA
jgi:hypothetical protein